MTTTEPVSPVTLRCGACLTLNSVDLTRSGDGPACGVCGRVMALDEPREVTEEDFERTVLQADAPVLVDFHADWCGPCKLVEPLLAELASEHAGRLLVVKVDTDRAPAAAERFAVRSIPALVFVVDGTEVSRSLGFEPERVRALAEEIVS